MNVNLTCHPAINGHLKLLTKSLLITSAIIFIGIETQQMKGTFVPKLTLGSFLTLSVRNEIERLGF